MKQIILGRTNEKVSTISLGTWSYGGENLSGEMPVGWAGQTDEDSRAALQRAWEVGINHWDTADVYGNGHSERIIGSMWKDVRRRDLFLASKTGWDKGDYSIWYHPDMMRKQVEQSLRNLQVDEIDLYYFHHCNFDSDAALDDAVETIYRFKEEGKIRFVGLSDWDSSKIMEFIERVDPDVVQPYRSVYDDMYAPSGLKARIDEHNIGVCFFSPLKHGLLTGKYTEPATFPDGDFRQNVKEFGDPDVLLKLQENKKILEEKFKDQPQPVLYGIVGALLTDVPTGCVLLGQRNKSQVEAAAELGEALSEEDARFVKNLYRKG
ncbi:MAG: hypothetical protein GWO85_01205 [Simkaniaceae bacterium]|nr:hypothetical protein [Simkaniaceae bacterium]